MVVAIVLSIGAARAGDAPATAAAPALPSEEACVAACKQLIARCTGVFGPGMGDMRPFCTRAVMRRCRSNGLKACEVVAREAS
jgi:hypothetical protein